MIASLLNPCLSTCGQRDLVLSNSSVLRYPLEKTWLQFYNNRKITVKYWHSEKSKSRLFKVNTIMRLFALWRYWSARYSNFYRLYCVQVTSLSRFTHALRRKGQQRMWLAPRPFTVADMSRHVIFVWFKGLKERSYEILIKMRIKTNLTNYCSIRSSN